MVLNEQNKIKIVNENHANILKKLNIANIYQIFFICRILMIVSLYLLIDFEEINFP